MQPVTERSGDPEGRPPSDLRQRDVRRAGEGADQPRQARSREAPLVQGQQARRGHLPQTSKVPMGHIFDPCLTKTRRSGDFVEAIARMAAADPNRKDSSWSTNSQPTCPRKWSILSPHSAASPGTGHRGKVRRAPEQGHPYVVPARPPIRVAATPRRCNWLNQVNTFLSILGRQPSGTPASGRSPSSAHIWRCIHSCNLTTKPFKCIKPFPRFGYYEERRNRAPFEAVGKPWATLRDRSATWSDARQSHYFNRLAPSCPTPRVSCGPCSAHCPQPSSTTRPLPPPSPTTADRTQHLNSWNTRFNAAAFALRKFAMAVWSGTTPSLTIASVFTLQACPRSRDGGRPSVAPHERPQQLPWLIPGPANPGAPSSQWSPSSPTPRSPSGTSSRTCRPSSAHRVRPRSTLLHPHCATEQS